MDRDNNRSSNVSATSSTSDELRPRPRPQQPRPNLVRPRPAAPNQTSTSRPAQPIPHRLVQPSDTSTLLVNANQKSNPLLQHIKVPWEYGQIDADYAPSPSIAILFLSFRYHKIRPEYISKRISKLKPTSHRILLIRPDVDNQDETLRFVTKTAVVNNLTVISAFSDEEAAMYISLFTRLKSAPTTVIQARQRDDFESQFKACLTSVRGVNSSDARTLMANFGTISKAVADGGKSFGDLQGWGDVKIRNFQTTIREPFLAKRSNPYQAYRNNLEKKFKNDKPIVVPRSDMSIVLPNKDAAALSPTTTVHNPLTEDRPSSVTAEHTPNRHTFSNAMAELNRIRSER
ncbi:restriction endonuclease type II-like protein [Lipomyces oligophaga]|uniref:restriction endonuclease type II-like protein n=1 Tax=Lipomyces oligophaga TaxID=45792 RepID=UPI0034CFD088